MQTKCSELLLSYHILLTQVKAEYECNETLTMQDALTVCADLPIYQQIKKTSSMDDLSMVQHLMLGDLQTFLHNRDANILNESPSWLMLKNFCWDTLFQGSDLTQVQTHTMAHDLKSEGRYLAGEVVSHGSLKCTHCGLIHEYEHLVELELCGRCKGRGFQRLEQEIRRLDS